MGVFGSMVGTAFVILVGMALLDGWETCKQVVTPNPDPINNPRFNTECQKAVGDITTAAQVFGGLVGVALGALVHTIIQEIARRS